MKTPPTDDSKTSRKPRYRSILVSLAGFIGFLILTVLVLNVWQFHARRRIAKILNTARSLEQTQAPPAEVKDRLLRAGADVSGHCSEENCNFDFIYTHPISPADSRTSRLFWRLMDSPLHDVFESIGFRRAGLRGAILIRAGKAKAASVGIEVGYAPLFIVGNQRDRFFWRYQSDPRLDAHPDFWVRQPNVTTFGGGEMLDVHITPDATPQEVEYAWAFNLSCITRWGGCSSAKELMPKAAGTIDPFQYQEEYRFRGCSIKRLARDTPIILRLRIKTVEPFRGNWEKYEDQFVHYHLLEIIKNSQNMIDVTRIGHVVRQGSLSADPYRPGLSPELFAPGNEVLLFAEHWTDDYINIDPDCGVLPADDEVLQRVREAVQKEQAF